MAHLVIATCDGIPDLTPDDQLLLAALLEKGVSVEVHSWDESAVPWDDFDAVVVRSVWDYHHRHEQMLSWITQVSATTPMFNSATTLSWNIHKGYLQEFLDAGLAVVPTAWISSPSKSLGQAMDEQGWQDVILKPAVSAAAMQTLRVTKQNLFAGEALLDEILPRCEAMVQPCLGSVREVGETPMVYFGGEFSHAVRRPSPLDHGEELIPEQPPLVMVEPTSVQFEVARSIIDFLDETPAYARVDLVDDDEGNPLLLELELIEPYLFLASKPESAERLASVILDSL